MNSTLPELGGYTDVQKGVLMPSTFVACTLVTGILFRYAHRRLRGKNTFLHRMQYIYSMIAGGLMGQFFAHTLPNSSVHPFSFSTDYAFAIGFLLLGFYIIMWIQKCGRVNNVNPNYTGPEVTLTEINHVVDPNTMEEHNYTNMDDLNSDEFSDKMWTIEDEKSELKRRRKMALFLFFTMLLIQVFEGFFLIYRNKSDKGLLIGLFVVDKLIESMIVIGALLHAFFHAIPGKKAFIALSIIWIIGTTASTIPVLTNMNYMDAQLVLQHPATSIFYALAGSIILWCTVYFVWIEPKKTGKGPIVVRLLLFGLFMSGSWLTAYFV